MRQEWNVKLEVRFHSYVFILLSKFIRYFAHTTFLYPKCSCTVLNWPLVSSLLLDTPSAWFMTGQVAGYQCTCSIFSCRPHLFSRHHSVCIHLHEFTINDCRFVSLEKQSRMTLHTSTFEYNFQISRHLAIVGIVPLEDVSRCYTLLMSVSNPSTCSRSKLHAVISRLTLYCVDLVTLFIERNLYLIAWKYGQPV